MTADDQPRRVVSDLGLPIDWHPGQIRIPETEGLTEVYDRCRVVWRCESRDSG